MLCGAVEAVIKIIRFYSIRLIIITYVIYITIDLVIQITHFIFNKPLYIIHNYKCNSL